MADSANEQEIAAIQLIVEEYRRLKKHNPDHELLKYIQNVSDDGFDNNKKYSEEFIDKYALDNNFLWSIALSRYYIDLRNEVDKIEGIDRSPKSPKTLEEKVHNKPENSNL